MQLISVHARRRRLKRPLVEGKVNGPKGKQEQGTAEGKGLHQYGHWIFTGRQLIGTLRSWVKEDNKNMEISGIWC